LPPLPARTLIVASSTNFMAADPYDLRSIR
jgi:hypothetical protein